MVGIVNCLSFVWEIVFLNLEGHFVAVSGNMMKMQYDSLTDY